MDNSRGSDVIYYTGYFRNERDVAVPIKFSKTETSNILDNMDDYYMSVVNAVIPSSGTYLFGVSEVIKFFVAVEVGGVVYDQQLVYESRGELLPPTSDTEDGIWTVKQLLSMINTAIDTAWTSSGATGDVPIMLEEGGRFTVRLPLVTDGQLYFNYPLGNKFKGLDMFFNSFTSSDGWRIINQDYGDNVIGSYVYNSQQSNSLELLTDIKSILITSSSIPGVKEYVSDNTYSTNQTFDIVADFANVLSPGTGVDYTDYIYIAGDGYRLIDIKSTGPLRKIEYEVRAQVKDGRSFRMRLLPGESAYVKFMFIKKSLEKRS